MQCRNHPDDAAVDRCAGCAELFCRKCLVPLAGQPYCASCKILPIKSMPVLEETTRPCPEASEALRMALFGILGLLIPIVGAVLGILAVTKGATARKMISDNPQLTGYGAATAGIIVGCMITLIAGLTFIASHN